MKEWKQQSKWEWLYKCQRFESKAYQEEKGLYNTEVNSSRACNNPKLIYLIIELQNTQKLMEVDKSKMIFRDFNFPK